MAYVITKGTALITGATTGIGATYAHRLAMQGYDLLLVAPDGRRLERLAEWLRAETDAAVETILADLAKEADLDALEDRVIVDDSLTFLVNSASMGAAALRPKPGLGHVADLIAVNVGVPARLAFAAAARFAARGVGTVVTIAPPVAGPAALPGTEDGGRSLLLMLARSLDEQAAGRGVRIQLVLPDSKAGPVWALAGQDFDGLAADLLLLAGELVDGALADLERRLVISRSSLPPISDWQALAERAERGALADLARPRVVELA